MSAEERAAFERSFSNDPQVQAALAKLSAPLVGVDSTPNSMAIDLDAAWLRQRRHIEAQLGRAQNRSDQTARPSGALFGPPRRTGWQPSGAIAGLALLVVLIVGGVLLRRGVPTADRTHTTTYATRAGQIAQVQLGNGSSIVLAPRTTVTLSDAVTDAATDGARLVSLVGDAQFHIVPNRRTPFVVRSGNAEVRVLGTTFEVRRYPGDAAGSVAVSSGKVVAQVGTSRVTITAGAASRFTDSAVTLAASGDSTMYVDWAQGRLVFREAPVSLVFATLRQWYGYEFRLADSTLNRHHVSAVFVAGDPREMLKAVKQVLNVSAVQRDSVIFLSPEQDAHRARVRERIRHDDSLTPQREVGR
jgi:transmembrane sensor